MSIVVVEKFSNEPTNWVLNGFDTDYEQNIQIYNQSRALGDSEICKLYMEIIYKHLKYTKKAKLAYSPGLVY